MCRCIARDVIRVMHGRRLGRPSVARAVLLILSVLSLAVSFFLIIILPRSIMLIFPLAQNVCHLKFVLFYVKMVCYSKKRNEKLLGKSGGLLSQFRHNKFCLFLILVTFSLRHNLSCFLLLAVLLLYFFLQPALY